MKDTALIILAICLGCVILAATFTLIVMAIDTIKGWKKDEHTD